MCVNYRELNKRFTQPPFISRDTNPIHMILLSRGHNIIDMIADMIDLGERLRVDPIEFKRKRGPACSIIYNTLLDLQIMMTPFRASSFRNIYFYPSLV